jgi:serine phosphatase RsbU (regulator of sigma subunit)
MEGLAEHGAGRRADALGHVLRSSSLVPPDQLPELVAEAAELLGAAETVLYLVDYEQRVLTPMQVPSAEQRTAQSVDGTLAGRCFRTGVSQLSDGPPARLWLPLLDGVERLGVVEVVPGEDDFSPSDPRIQDLGQLAHLTAELLVSKQSYTDAYEWHRRQQPMALAAEMQHLLLPPHTFGTDRLVVSALVAPAYEMGGDAFDYALNGHIAHLAVFDAIGHGLQASALANVAVSCYRNSRRAGLDLAHAALLIDRTVAELFSGERFVTALLAQLDVVSGELRWVDAGHPAPLLLRGGHVVKELTGPTAMPLGLNGLLGEPGAEDFPVAVESLEPGDRLLLVTDGVDEARTEDGAFFGRDRLAEFAAREATSGLPTPEVLRRLHQAFLRYQTGLLQDDATTVLVEWLADPEQRLPV